MSNFNNKNKRGWTVEEHEEIVEELQQLAFNMTSLVLDLYDRMSEEDQAKFRKRSPEHFDVNGNPLWK